MVAPQWKYNAHSITRESDADNFVGELMSREEFRKHGEQAADFAQDLQTEREALGEILGGRETARAVRRPG